MSERVPLTILKNLLHDEEYTRKVLPFIQSDYFDEISDKTVFEEIASFLKEYDGLPTKEAIHIQVEKRNDLNQDQFTTISQLIDALDTIECKKEWLFDITESWCKERAIYNALMESIKIADGQDEKKKPDAIPSILSDALAVGFDQHVGHDYIDDSQDRYAYYHKVENKIPFDLEYFNKITKGGVPNKTLNIALAGTGVGKSLFMCHVASSALVDGKNVLYITMEMAEEKIAERIDANLLNVPIDQLPNLSREMFRTKVEDIARKTTGKLIVKEYPTGSAHAGHFRALLNELKLKRQFEPDIIFIDYLNICASSRMKGMGGAINSYNYIKAIAEELRGLAVEFDVPVFSATQTTRSGYTNSDVGLEDTSESFGLPATADLMFALISTEELENMGQMMVKQLKNRYNDPTRDKRFVIGVDRGKMRLYDVDENEQTLTDDTPVFDKTDMQEKMAKFKDFTVV